MVVGKVPKACSNTLEGEIVFDRDSETRKVSFLLRYSSNSRGHCDCFVSKSISSYTQWFMAPSMSANITPSLVSEALPYLPIWSRYKGLSEGSLNIGIEPVDLK